MNIGFSLFRNLALACLVSLPLLRIEADPCEIMENISLRATQSHSDIVLIAHQNNIEFIGGSRKQLEPIDSRSITKSFVCLAIGLLMQEECIESVDTPVYAFFPEWKQGYKQQVTIRHLLNHTSGLQTDGESAYIYQFPDAIKMALASDFSTPPGTCFIYNNKAVNLLAGIVEKAAGMSVHEYLKTRLFNPLCITTVSWLCDKAGNNYGMSHMAINAVDLTKVGILIANDGCWNGRRLISPEWLQFMKQPSQSLTPFYGPLWWLGFYSMKIYWDEDLLTQYSSSGIPCSYVESLRKLQGQVLSFEGHICYGNYREQFAAQLEPYFANTQEVYQFLGEIEARGLTLGRWDVGALKSISARGHLGQQLIVFPQENVVAVRLSNSCRDGVEYKDTFPELESWIALLVYEMNLYNR